MSVDPLSNVTVLLLCGLLGMFLTFWVGLISASIEKIRMARWAGISEAASRERAEALSRVHPRAPGLTSADLERYQDPSAPYDQTRDQDPGSV